MLGLVHLEGEEGVEDGVADLAGEEHAAVVALDAPRGQRRQLEVKAKVHVGARHLIHIHPARQRRLVGRLQGYPARG